MTSRLFKVQNRLIHLRRFQGKDYHAAFEISFVNGFHREKFFASSWFTKALNDGASLIDMIKSCPGRFASKFGCTHKMTMAGQRGSSVSKLVNDLGTINQTRDDIHDLMLTNQLT